MADDKQGMRAKARVPRRERRRKRRALFRSLGLDFNGEPLAAPGDGHGLACGCFDCLDARDYFGLQPEEAPTVARVMGTNKQRRTYAGVIRD